MRPHRLARRGFTLVEMMMAITILGIIIAASLGFFQAQTRTVSGAAGRMDASQNARFAVNAIDREIRMAGVGVVDPQPVIVYAASSAVTFNGDLVAHDSADKGAVYYDADQDVLATNALVRSRQITLPLTAARYPDTNYVQGSGATGTPSTAETISYWVAPDSATTRADDYVLYRRVNDRAPTVVVRSVLLPTGEPLFRYYKVDTLGKPVEISQVRLPLRHSAVIHGASGDTAGSALTDSINVIRVRVTSFFTDRRGVDQRRTIETAIRVVNAGLVRHATCGEAPILGVALNAVPTGGASPQVALHWNRANDEGGGEKDVERYALYRRLSTDVLFGEPFAGVAAGLPSYDYIDTQVQSGDSWVYGVAAQDCSPANSPIAQVGPVIIP